MKDANLTCPTALNFHLGADVGHRENDIDRNNVRNKKMKTRRSKMNKKKERVVTIMYSNIQGITKKKESLLNIMEEINCDICLLAETMTCRIKIPGLTLLTLGFFV